MTVSKYNRSVACEEIETQQEYLESLSVRYLSISGVSTDTLPATKQVVVSGSITVSF